MEDADILEQLGASEATEIETEHGNRKIWLLKVRLGPHWSRLLRATRASAVPTGLPGLHPGAPLPGPALEGRVRQGHERGH